MVRPLFFADKEPQTIETLNFQFISIMRALALYLPKATHLHTKSREPCKGLKYNSTMLSHVIPLKIPITPCPAPKLVKTSNCRHPKFA